MKAFGAGIASSIDEMEVTIFLSLEYENCEISEDPAIEGLLYRIRRLKSA